MLSSDEDDEGSDELLAGSELLLLLLPGLPLLLLLPAGLPADAELGSSEALSFSSASNWFGPFVGAFT